MADRAPQMGAMSGCCTDTVPSAARWSPHASSSCASGTCQAQCTLVSSRREERWIAVMSSRSKKPAKSMSPGAS